MALKIQTHETGGVTILTLRGSIFLGSGDDDLRAAVDRVLADGKKNIVLHLKGLKDIDSSGVGEIVGCYTSVARRGGMLKLVGLGDRAYDVLALTQLIHVFQSFDDEASAIGSFAPAATGGASGPTDARAGSPGRIG
ncbi:MAG: STAS domain-containing protein [Acidobacteriota bacterium]